MGDPVYLEKMGRELKCPICLSLLNSAVSLSCNHSFCNACIVKSMKSGSDCPVCKVPYRRREIRAAPHMDNLVNIYKSMELASGFNIFVTQNAQSPKLPGELKEIGGGATNCGKENIGDTTTDDRVENKGKLKRKGSTTNDMAELEVSDSVPEKPSFPTKKRVQVPKYPFSETSLHPKEAIGPDRSVKDSFRNSSQHVKDDSVVNEMGKPVLSPFFWLRDEDVEKPSQCTNNDQLLEMTPPDVPTFSDIKDSDDENSPPMEEACEQSNVAGLSDIEMFEWTQIPCSPDVFSGPDKIPTKHSNVKMQGSGISSMSANKNEDPSIGSDKCLYTTQGTHILNELLPSESSPRTNSNDNPIGCPTSNKRGRRGTMLKRCTKKNVDRDFNAPVGSMTASKTTEAAGNNCSSSSSPKTSKTTKKAGFGSLATKTNLKNASADSVGTSANKSTEMAPNEFPAPSCEKPVGDEDLKMKNTRRIRGKINPQSQINQPIRLKRQKINSTDINMTEEDNATENQTDEDANHKASLLSDPEVADQQISVLRKKPCQHKESKSALISVCNQELLSRKSRKVSFNNISEDGLANDHREFHGEVSAVQTQFLEKVGNVSTKGTESTLKSPGTLDAKIKDDPVTMGGHCKRNGVAPSYQKTLTDKTQCAFCHSSEESEASGEMVHYSNGIPVAADFNDRHKMINSHRNCAEWAPNVYFEGDNAINLEAEVTRSRRITCCCCGLKGAALGCYEKSCRKSFHVPCAKSTPQCRWDSENFVMLCPLHVSSKLPNENAVAQKRTRKNCIPKGPLHNQSAKEITNAINNFPKWDSCGTRKKLVLCCSALTDGEMEIVSEFERLSGITLLKKWDSSVTHIIASTDENGSCRRTLKILMGILEGKWILNIEWVRACMKTMRLVPEVQYEIAADIHGIRDGPRLGRLRLLNKQPKIFDGFKFHFMGDFIASYRGYIQDLVIAGGGTILHRKPISGSPGLLGSTPSTFIVYSLEVPDKGNCTKKNTILKQRQADAEALANSTGAKAASNLWVLNSIAACKLQNFAQKW